MARRSYRSKNFLGVFRFGTSRQTVKKVGRMTKTDPSKLEAVGSMAGWEIWRKK